jgi:hypothetical protein
MVYEKTGTSGGDLNCDYGAGIRARFPPISAIFTPCLKLWHSVWIIFLEHFKQASLSRPYPHAACIDWTTCDFRRFDAPSDAVSGFEHNDFLALTVEACSRAQSCEPCSHNDHLCLKRALSPETVDCKLSAATSAVAPASKSCSARRVRVLSSCVIRRPSRMNTWAQRQRSQIVANTHIGLKWSRAGSTQFPTFSNSACF